MSKKQSLSLAKAFQDLLIRQGIPVQRMFLYGSMARDEATEDSDIDIAVVCTPFRATRMDENMELWRARRQVDSRIEPICLHQEDFDNRLFGLAQEVKRTGLRI